MKKKLVYLLFLLPISVMMFSQTTKQITCQWNEMPVGEMWTQIRLYDISAVPEVLLSTVSCTSAGVGCPVQATFTIQKKSYTIVARSFDDVWESIDSNVVILKGPPKPPAGLLKK